MIVQRVRVLVVDDSAFVRKTIGAILAASPHLEVVGYAGDGREALDQVKRLRPDVVTVDLEMPRLDGVEFIREQMKIAPLPIVVVSSVDASGELASASMQAGAVEFVLKPTHLADQRLGQIEAELLAKVYAVAEITAARLTLGSEASEASLLESQGEAAPQAVVFGLSTGGPQLLHAILPRLPADFPLPIAVVIHMPVGFTGPLAERIDSNSQLEVLEAKAGLAMRPGRCLIARAGQHLRFQARRGQVEALLTLEPSESTFRPSVDVLFRSASEHYGNGLLAFVLTGMGQDGREGSAWVKAAGGRVYTQTEETSTVWGMPRAVFESGLSDGELAPLQIVPFLKRLVSEKPA